MLPKRYAPSARLRASCVIGVFVLSGACGFLPLRADAPRAEPAGLDPELAETRERIRDMVGGMKDVPLPVIVEALTAHRVLPWKGESKETLLRVSGEIERLIDEGGIEAARMNEAGNKVEAFVIEALRGLGFEASRSKTESGRMRVAGYPDIEVTIEGAAFYIEVKTFSAATVDSTQRSFYLSPSTDFKVTRDAIHLLVAIELSAGAKGAYRAQSVRWLDLSGLLCDLKYEFNASNRDLYRRESGLVIVESPRSDTALHPAAVSEGGGTGSPPP